MLIWQLIVDIIIKVSTAKAFSFRIDLQPDSIVQNDPLAFTKGSHKESFTRFDWAHLHDLDMLMNTAACLGQSS